jgi:hypothetical protein
MAGRPEVLNELYEEALAFDKGCNGSVTLADVQNMVKLDSLVKESLRHAGNISKHNLNSPYILNYNYDIKIIFILHSVNLGHHMVSKSYTFSNGFTIPEGKLIKIIYILIMCIYY